MRAINDLQRRYGHFDAAFFNSVVPMTFLRRFQRDVPTIISIDGTPISLTSMASWYGSSLAGRFKLLQRLKYSLARQIYSRAKYLLPWSELARDSLLMDYGIPETNVAVVPPGVDLGKWESKPKRRGRSPKVLFVGRDFMRKGGDVLLSGASKPEFQDFEFHFVTKSRLLR